MFKTKELTTIALLTALCVVGRLLTSPIPNVQPVTAIILFVAIYTSIPAAMIISTLSMLITNLYLGTGIWTIAQILTYILLILIVGAIRQMIPLQKYLVIQLFLCVGVSMGYGFLVTLMLAPFWGVTAFWPYYLVGISFDMMHSIGTVLFFIVLRYPLIKIFTRYQFIHKSRDD